jgi:hypothetical protein
VRQTGENCRSFTQLYRSSDIWHFGNPAELALLQLNLEKFRNAEFTAWRYHD